MAACALPAAELFFTTGTMRDETRLLLRHLERDHYLRKPVSALDMNQLIEHYLEDLDAARLFFLAPEVSAYQQNYAPKLVAFLENGRLDPAFEIFRDYHDRATERLDWVEARLDQPFDFSSQETYFPDRTDAAWPATQAEADRIWEKRLKHQMLVEIMAEWTPEQALAQSTTSTQADAPARANAARPVPGEADVEALSGIHPDDLRPDADTPEDGSAAFEDILEAANNPPLPDVLVISSEEPTAEEAEESEEVVDYDTAVERARETLRSRYENLRKAIGYMDASEVQEVFLTSLTRMYDPHSSFMTADAMEDFGIAMQNALAGIGAVLTTEDGYCVIRELIPGGPAYASGELEAGLRIVSVGQGDDGELVDVVGMPLDDIVRLIRGEKGSVVRLGIREATETANPEAAAEPRIVRLERDKVKLTTGLATGQLFEVPLGEATMKVGVVELPSFYGADEELNQSNTTDDVAELIGKLEAMGAEGIVLDLRKNGGGYLNEAVRLTGLFVERAPVVQIRSSNGQIEQLVDRDTAQVWTGPLMVLISRHSASASEITAGALQDYQRALIVGDPETHGKGTVQGIMALGRSSFFSRMVEERGGAKITTRQFFLPKGASTQIRGVVADIAFPTHSMLLPIGESDLDNPLPWQEIAPSRVPMELGAGVLVDEALVEELTLRSEQRQENLPEFDYLRESISHFEELFLQKEHSLNLAQRRAEEDLELQYEELMEARREKLKELEFARQDILLDLALAQQAADTDSEEVDVTDLGLDIHLRESLRIMADWISISSSAQAEDQRITQKDSEDQPG